MTTYYVSSSNKYNFIGIQESNKSISELQKIILYTPNFCRDQLSISTTELKSYIVSGITFFTRNALNQITGLVNFDVNGSIINVLGICVPGYSQGIGSNLINLVKKFAKANNISNIKLTCYDNLKSFYIKLGFQVENESSFYDSDEDSDDNKIRYDMIFNMANFTGGKRKNKSKSKNKRKNNKRRRTLKKYI
jgi:hypothetical protein